MSLFSRKTSEEKEADRAAKADRRAAKERAKEQRAAEFRAKLEASRETRNREKEERLREKEERREQEWEAMRAMLADGETIEAEYTTAETIMKKDLIFTDRRLLVRPRSTKDVESILYRSISSFRTANFVTRDIVLQVTGRREGDLELLFDGEEKRDQALAIVTKFTT